MMKDLKELVLPVADRIRNPFFGSVAVSWLLVNWKLIVILFGDTSKDLEKAGFTSYIAYVEGAGAFHLIILPLLLGIAYLFLNPWIKMWHSAINEYFAKKTNEKNAKILKGGYIPIKRFFALKDEYLAMIEKATTLVSNEDGYRKQAADAMLQKEEAENVLKKINAGKDKESLQLSKLNLKGIWYMTFNKTFMDKKLYTLHIDTDKHVATTKEGDEEIVLFRIEKIFYDTFKNTATMILMPAKKEDKVFFDFSWVELTYSEPSGYKASKFSTPWRATFLLSRIPFEEQQSTVKMPPRYVFDDSFQRKYEFKLPKVKNVTDTKI